MKGGHVALIAAVLLGGLAASMLVVEMISESSATSTSDAYSGLLAN